MAAEGSRIDFMFLGPPLPGRWIRYCVASNFLFGWNRIIPTAIPKWLQVYKLWSYVMPILETHGKSFFTFNITLFTKIRIFFLEILVQSLNVVSKFTEVFTDLGLYIINLKINYQ